jgi:hypothetical protein
MCKWLLIFGLLILLYSGCTTNRRAIQEQRDSEVIFREKQELLDKARVYLKNRDYAKCLDKYFESREYRG